VVMMCRCRLGTVTDVPTPVGHAHRRGHWARMGQGVHRNSVVSTQICYKPKIAQKKFINFLKKQVDHKDHCAFFHGNRGQILFQNIITETSWSHSSIQILTSYSQT